MGQEAVKCLGNLGSIGMAFVEVDFDQAILLKAKTTRQRQDILGQAQWAKVSKGAGRKHPVHGPGEQVMGQVGEQDEGFLGCQLLFAAAFELQAALVGLNLSFAGAAVIIIGDHFGQRPVQNRGDEGAVLELAALGLPA